MQLSFYNFAHLVNEWKKERNELIDEAGDWRTNQLERMKEGADTPFLP